MNNKVNVLNEILFNPDSIMIRLNLQSNGACFYTLTNVDDGVDIKTMTFTEFTDLPLTAFKITQVVKFENETLVFLELKTK